MSEHKAHLKWKRSTPDFVYETYDRTHTIRFEGGISIQASSAPEFAGKAEFVNPEEAFAGALCSCHMLTFLAIACKSKFILDSYEDDPVAVLEKNAEGKLAVTTIHLRPKVVFSGANQPDAKRLSDLHEKAHANCFIGNSIKSRVVVEPRS